MLPGYDFCMGMGLSVGRLPQLLISNANFPITAQSNAGLLCIALCPVDVGV
jgi:hypothetical protein